MEQTFRIVERTFQIVEQTFHDGERTLSPPFIVALHYLPEKQKRKRKVKTTRRTTVKVFHLNDASISDFFLNFAVETQTKQPFLGYINFIITFNRENTMRKIYLTVLLSVFSISSLFAQTADVTALPGEYQGKLSIIAENGLIEERSTSVTLEKAGENDYTLTLKGYKLNNAEFPSITIPNVKALKQGNRVSLTFPNNVISEKAANGQFFSIGFKDEYRISHISIDDKELALSLAFRTAKGFGAYVTTKTIFTGKKQTTTGIREVEQGDVSAKKSVVYHLNGQRATKPQRGIFIVNGKKVLYK